MFYSVSMTVAGLNFVGVLVATIVSVASGALWFGPKTFYPIWMKARGIASGRLREDHNPAILFGGTFVGVAVQTVTLGLVITSLQSLNPSFTTIDGAGVGLGQRLERKGVSPADATAQVVTQWQIHRRQRACSHPGQPLSLGLHHPGKNYLLGSSVQALHVVQQQNSPRRVEGF